MQEKNKKWVIAIFIVCVIALIGFFTKDFFTTKTAGDSNNINDLQSAYSIEIEQKQILEKLKTNVSKAEIFTTQDNKERQVIITFDGLTDSTTVQRILDILKKHEAKATFFVDGMQSAENPSILVNIKNSGQKIENYTLFGRKAMEKLTQEELVKDFAKTQKIISVNTDKTATFLKCNDTIYTDEILKVAKACGLNSAVKSDVYLNVKQLNSPSGADNFVKTIKPGSVISLKLKLTEEIVKKEPVKTEAMPAIDKQPGLKQIIKEDVVLDKATSDAVEKLLIALKKANYKTAYLSEIPQKVANRQVKATNIERNFLFKEQLDRVIVFLQNTITSLINTKKAYAGELKQEELKNILTVEPALAFTFGEISDASSLEIVLNKLQTLDIKATFFVTEVEMLRQPENVKRIIRAGHEIGLAIRPKDDASVEQVQEIIIRTKKMLKDKFALETNLIKQPWGKISENTKIAIARLNCRIIGQSLNLMQIKHQNYKRADDIIAEVFKPSMLALAKGDILYFRINFYNEKNIIPDLVEKIKILKVDNIAYNYSFDNPKINKFNNSSYKLKTVGSILANKQAQYSFPVEITKVPENLRSDSNNLVIEKEDFLAEVSKRYIGNRDITPDDRMLGFSKMDARRFDTTGYVNTQENVIFLTFDDWGTDASINKLLYVLRKHKVKATFFVLTNNVLFNPNLLRSIAIEGHDIASHSDKHKAMVVRDPLTKKQVRTSTKEEYLKDYTDAYIKLRSLTGDIVIDGKPVLTRFFRPPTLAISRIGFEALFETSYTNVICGSGNMYDYKAENAGQLVNRFKEVIYTPEGNIQKGAVLIFHMSDVCAYTAAALDILLTANEGKAANDRTKFKVGKLSDYLNDNYVPVDIKKSIPVNR